MKISTLALAALPAALAVSLVGAPAASAATKIDVESGKLYAKGAAIRVPVTFVCEQGFRGSLQLRVLQAADDGFASSSIYKSFTCTGKTVTKRYYLQANSSGGYYEGGSGRPFRSGSASAVAYLNAYKASSPCAKSGCAKALPGLARPGQDPSRPPSRIQIGTSADAASVSRSTKVEKTISLR